MYPFIFVMDMASRLHIPLTSTWLSENTPLSVIFIHSPPTSIVVVFGYLPHSLQLHAETEKAGKCHFSFLAWWRIWSVELSPKVASSSQYQRDEKLLDALMYSSDTSYNYAKGEPKIGNLPLCQEKWIFTSAM